MKRVVTTVCLSLFLLSLVTVVIVCVVVGEDNVGSDLEFWQTEIIYQVYPRSLLDADRDGTGDLPGVTSKAEYLAGLGVGAVWLSPFFQSPMKDFGYDISNYTAVDPIFGTMADFEEMVAELHRRGLKVILDFVPNHTSDQHEWFLKSVKREDPYTDYFVWADSEGTDEEGLPIPPNNWLSVFRGSAWEWSEERKQFYYHQFLAAQPDLNFRCDAVREEMKNVLTFWMDKGVDGFRVDAVKHLYEVEDLSLDEPLAPGHHNPSDYDSLQHPYTSNQPENLDAVREWRKLLDARSEKAFMVEVFGDTVEEVMNYYGTEEDPLADFPFNFQLIDNLESRKRLDGESLKATVSLWLDNLPAGKWPNWVLGNHDKNRVSSRLGTDLIDALNMVILLLPGTPVTYYGEEIGMEDTFISWEDTVDPSGCRWGPDLYQKYSRDPARTPMQWDNRDFAGFTNGSSTWLPVNPNYPKVNVARQVSASASHLKVYQQLAQLRREDTFLRGNTTFPVTTKDVFSFMRSLEGSDSYLIVVNTNEEEIKADLLKDSTEELPSNATVVLRSASDTSSATQPGAVVSLDAVPLLGGEGLVLALAAEEDN